MKQRCQLNGSAGDATVFLPHTLKREPLEYWEEDPKFNARRDDGRKPSWIRIKGHPKRTPTMYGKPLPQSINTAGLGLVWTSDMEAVPVDVAICGKRYAHLIDVEECRKLFDATRSV